MKLINRANGCDGSYCIGRKMKRGEPWWEFWNEELRRWSAFGTVYTKKQAEKKMAKLKTSK